MTMRAIKSNGSYFELDHIQQLYIMDDNIMISCTNGIKTILSAHEYNTVDLVKGDKDYAEKFY